MINNKFILWNNQNITIDGNLVFWKSWFDSNIIFIHDLIDSEGNLTGSSLLKKNIICGVPQGSVLGPLLYVLYTAPVADIIRRYGLGFHFYADGTQLYLALSKVFLTSWCL